MRNVNDDDDDDDDYDEDEDADDDNGNNYDHRRRRDRLHCWKQKHFVTICVSYVISLYIIIRQYTIYMGNE